MIICLTPNPAIDRILFVPNLALGEVLRVSGEQVTAGGKGINVARALARLGRDHTSIGLVGGKSGEELKRLAEGEFNSHWVSTTAHTRINYTLTDSERGTTTVLNMPGGIVPAGDWANFVAEATAASNSEDDACICGSLPPGVPRGGLSALIGNIKGKRTRVWIDMSGEPLEQALECRPYAVKINASEALVLLGAQASLGVESIARLILDRSGAVFAVVTGGAKGACMATSDAVWKATTPAVDVTNVVGSGDASLAGLVAAHQDGEPPEQMLASCVAAGTASVQRVVPGELDRGEWKRLRHQVNIQRI